MARLMITRCFKSYDINAHGSSGYTPLTTAAYNGHLEAAALLIERGAKVNHVDDSRETPLDWAHRAYQISTKMVAFLKSKGAKRTIELPQPST